MTLQRHWQRSELLLALQLYCHLPFGQYHTRAPEIIKLATLLGRTPSAVAMKLSNFASFDPYHQSRGIKGLQNTGRADRAIWDEFHADWEALAVESELSYAALAGTGTVSAETIPSATAVGIFSGPTETERSVKIRLGQQFFRRVILTSYANRCCICGLPIPDLLVASHIVPWRDDAQVRVNPHNGLCLCVLHDKGFDRGLITVGEDYEVIISRAITSYLPDQAIYTGFMAYEGQRIALPDKFLPQHDFLRIHRNQCFVQ